MNCPNCGNLLIVPPMLIMTHVHSQIDCITGESFIPVARVVNGQDLELWPEDYICERIKGRFQYLQTGVGH